MKKLLIIFSVFLALPCNAKSTLLLEVDSGKVIYSRDSNQPVSIASLTKLVTVLTVVTARQDLTERLRVVGNETSSRLSPGMRVSRMGLIELALISSDNLAARTLLEHYPGGYQKGLSRMNEIVRQIGAKNTKLVDATGLLAGNVSTSRDIAKILKETGKYRLFSTLSNVQLSYIPIEAKNRNHASAPPWAIARSTNPYVHEQRRFHILSAKTGYTTAAGFCLAMYVTYKNKRYILVTTGNRSRDQRKIQSDKLLDLILISRSPT